MKNPDIEIQDTKTVYVAWTNTDLTEGRGYEVPLAVTETEATAMRLGRGKYVQGSDCRVTLHVAVKVAGRWLVPGQVHAPTEEDKKAEAARLERVAVIERAKAAGLTDADIELLKRST